jgi:hypothetical protein
VELGVEPKVKGVAVREFMRWYVSAHGTRALEKAIAAMPPEEARHLHLEQPALGLLAGTWYPASMIHRLLDGMGAGLRGHERAALIRDGAHATIHHTLSGVYKLLFQAMMSPERYARNAQQLFARYFNTGTMEKTPITTPDGQGHLSVVRDWTSHHPMLCDLLSCTAEYVYAELGCRDVEVKKTGCVASGQAECTFVFTWRKVA